MSITETIDQAIQDYGLSADAMRWAPEDPAGDLPRHAIVTFQPGMVVSFHFDAGGFIQAVERAREAIQGLGYSAGVWFDESRRWERARRARLRRMHSSYPAKWRRAR